MTPDEPIDPPAPPSGSPAAPPADPTAPSGGARARPTGAPPGLFPWLRQTAKLWGFLGFCVLVLVLFRQVVLPFVFAGLLAFILAPLIKRMSQAGSGARRMPRGAAILMVYAALLACVTLFFLSLLPRLSEDVARLGREAPSAYERVNDEWAPRFASWLERQFPSLATPVPQHPIEPIVADVPLPPRTGFVLTPLPDGRYAIAVEPTGVSVRPGPDGSYTMLPNERAPAEIDTEDRIRAVAARALLGLQAQIDDFFLLGRRVVASTIGMIFKFFLVLMLAAFILLDIGKFHGFVRGLVPSRYGHDYEVVVAGIDRGLSGVIRGQLMICLINGLLTYVGLLVFSVKYSLVLAAVATLLSLIPIFGTVLSTIPIVLAALVSGDAGVDITRGVFILAWILGIHFIEANLLNPKIMGDAAKIHPVLVIFALLAGEHSAGLVGALLAVPAASVIQVLFLFFRSKAWRTESSVVAT